MQLVRDQNHGKLAPSAVAEPHGTEVQQAAMDGGAMGESCHVGLGQAMELSEAEVALLMDLMEDLPASDALDGDVDRLSHVIRSLEAEIGDEAARMVDGEGVAGASGEDGVMLEDMLMDLDHHEGGLSFGCWPEVSSIGHEAEGNWYVYSNGYEGGVVGYEAIDHQYHCCAEGSIEQAAPRLLRLPLTELSVFRVAPPPASFACP
ncbi:uncharacterized protein C2845_PM11G19460 [Panicum miliaceum]|uniref:Uncharacterized protein n=1 Tax=Panicum miliaceum TaxID=4540 RepID=A0A3L6RQK8_PANMI|nr:uncharacterized protein C2845_PM11G19460 [Panicum miliaceum]